LLKFPSRGQPDGASSLLPIRFSRSRANSYPNVREFGHFPSKSLLPLAHFTSSPPPLQRSSSQRHYFHDDFGREDDDFGWFGFGGVARVPPSSELLPLAPHGILRFPYFGASFFLRSGVFCEVIVFQFISLSNPDLFHRRRLPRSSLPLPQAFFPHVIFARKSLILQGEGHSRDPDPWRRHPRPRPFLRSGASAPTRLSRVLDARTFPAV